MGTKYKAVHLYLAVLLWTTQILAALAECKLYGKETKTTYSKNEKEKKNKAPKCSNLIILANEREGEEREEEKGTRSFYIINKNFSEIL